MIVETTQFPRYGSSQTLAHSFSFINVFKRPNFWLLGATSIHKIQRLSLISQDFMRVKTTQFPKNCSSQTPTHSFSFINCFKKAQFSQNTMIIFNFTGFHDCGNHSVSQEWFKSDTSPFLQRIYVSNFRSTGFPLLP